MFNFSFLFRTPPDLTPVQKKNFQNVQIDGIAIGMASAAGPFLPVFLARLGATNFQVGLLTSMPALTGLFIAMTVGRFLQSRRQVVPWFSAARLLVISAYAATGIVPFLVPQDFIVPVVLAIWALATVPQIFVNVSFSVVMSAVAGPKYRYELMTQRWSTLGLATAITVAVVGQILNLLTFPINYQIVFVGLSIGGLISYYYSSHIELPDAEPPPQVPGRSAGGRLSDFVRLVLGQPQFTSFMVKRFVFVMGTALAVPLFPLYYVNVVQANDAWIGIINTAKAATTIVGYFFWANQSRQRGGKFVLLWVTFGLAIYPILAAFTRQVEWLVLYAGLAGIFQAGLELVFFDELMKTFPAKYSATFVGLMHSVQYVAQVIAPLVGTGLADYITLSGGLVVSGVLSMMGFVLFAWRHPE